MRRAVIVSAARTAIGRRNGSLSGWHPAELAAHVLSAVTSRVGVDPQLVDDVILGCVTQVGTQSMNVARTAVLAAGFPDTVPATTIDRQCGSSQQALHFAAQGIMSGAIDVAIAGGVECMSSVQMFSNCNGDPTSIYGKAVSERYANRSSFGIHGLIPQGISSELMIDKWGLTRQELDEFALRSQQRAAVARDQGRFWAEIVPIESRRPAQGGTGTIVIGPQFDTDECIRATSREALAGLKAVFVDGGRVTAGNASQISDGAAALLIMSEERAAQLGIRPRAVVSHMSVVGSDPVLMLDGPIPATRKVLERAGLTPGDIDCYEVNEAFAPVVLAWQRELAVDPDRVNVNGGAIALGHPLGASGARLAVTLMYELERTKGRFGLQAICEGGGMANATVIERLPE
jgi:acetyl-CoA acyltransferase